MIEVLKSGLYTSIQDTGRLGYREIGVPVSGTMDKYSSDLANAILKNDRDSAVLEMTMIGAKLQFKVDTLIVISGANMSPMLNGVIQEHNKVVRVKSGDVLSFGAAKYGLYCYLAVKGGFKTEIVLESRSYYSGITESDVVKTKDMLPIDSFSSETIEMPQFSKLKPYDFSTSILNLFKGPEFYLLSDLQKEKLINSEFKVSKLYNRMAYQLNPNLANNLKPILTGPVLPGTLQLTPSGKLIVLMRDCQTTGGYPRVLQLSSTSINLLSQKNQTDIIRFKLVDL